MMSGNSRWAWTLKVHNSDRILRICSPGNKVTASIKTVGDWQSKGFLGQSLQEHIDPIIIYYKGLIT